MVNRLTAKATDGVFISAWRIPTKREEIEGGAEDILEGLNAYGVTIDEGFVAPGEVRGRYGPYQQSERAESIMPMSSRSCFRDWLSVLCTPEDLDTIRGEQERRKLRTGYYGTFARCRSLTPEEALEKIRQGQAYVVRLRSPGSEGIVSDLTT